MKANRLELKGNFNLTAMNLEGINVHKLKIDSYSFPLEGPHFPLKGLTSHFPLKGLTSFSRSNTLNSTVNPASTNLKTKLYE